MIIGGFVKQSIMFFIGALIIGFGIFSFQNCSPGTNFNTVSSETPSSPSDEAEVKSVVRSAKWTVIDQTKAPSAFGRGITGIATKVIEGEQTVVAVSRWYSADPRLYASEIVLGTIGSDSQINFNRSVYNFSAKSYGAGSGAMILGVTHFNDRLIGIGYTQSLSGVTDEWNFLKSENGIDWIPYFDRNVGAQYDYPRAIASNSSVVVVANSKTFFTSTTGLSDSWQPVSGSFPDVSEIIWTGSQFVASTSSNQFYRSSDGYNWTSFVVPSTDPNARIAFGRSTFVLISGLKIYLTKSLESHSPQWTEVIHPITDVSVLSDVHFADGEFVILASSSLSGKKMRMFSSVDAGKTWVEDESEFNFSQNGTPSLFDAYSLLIATRNTQGGGSSNMAFKPKATK